MARHIRCMMPLHCSLHIPFSILCCLDVYITNTFYNLAYTLYDASTHSSRIPYSILCCSTYTLQTQSMTRHIHCVCDGSPCILNIHVMCGSSYIYIYTYIYITNSIYFILTYTLHIHVIMAQHIHYKFYIPFSDGLICNCIFILTYIRPNSCTHASAAT